MSRIPGTLSSTILNEWNWAVSNMDEIGHSLVVDGKSLDLSEIVAVAR